VDGAAGVRAVQQHGRVEDDEMFLTFNMGVGMILVVAWALGARVGILRESFTAPGVSVSAMYRSIGSFSYGDPRPRAVRRVPDARDQLPSRRCGPSSASACSASA
jgi:hypothetical protein